ncbi:hypothetical protein [Chitinimonas sp. JJ19]|uniref:hypothetical protein n=1 Tax=Chitinimonas sp. JJ19 TaxID=3109352 RepID=UPI00300146A2
MKKTLVIAIALLPIALPSLAADKVLLSLPIVYSDETEVRDKIKDECSLEAVLAEQLEQQLTKRNKDGRGVVEEDKDTAGYAVMRVQIASAVGNGGGSWSGRKSMMVRAELVEEGKETRTVEFRRATSGVPRFWTPFRSTCALFRHVSKGLSKDLYNWAYNPKAKIENDPVEPAKAEPAVAEDVKAS